jgi:hypothetical protein
MDERSSPKPGAGTRDSWLAETWAAHRELGRFFRDLAIATMCISAPFLVCCCFVNPIAPGNGGGRFPESSLVQTAHALGLAMYSFASDNNGHYPDGKSSTEVFQQLLDGGYVTDPHFLYVRMAGKVEPDAGQKKLRPENIGWDVTGGVTQSDSGTLPLLFLTGLRISYSPGASAFPQQRELPEYLPTVPHFWFFGGVGGVKGVAVFYVNNSSAWLNPENDSIPHFVGAAFDAHGKTYRQLTPDGPLR